MRAGVTSAVWPDAGVEYELDWFGSWTEAEAPRSPGAGRCGVSGCDDAGSCGVKGCDCDFNSCGVACELVTPAGTSG